MSAPPLPPPAFAVADLQSPAWQRAFVLLDHALDLPESDRADWLRSLVGEDAAARPLLERLMAGHETDDFMAAPAAAALRALAPTSAPARDGGIVGPYRLLREIGRGGMATVWLAERADGLLERQVALKLPHAGFDAAALADRMTRERRILAALAHPNIARLYDAGVTADGRPYLALEYVPGRPIVEFAEARGLDTRARVALVVQVARAVGHAHAQLVVHRDLKPSNIVVGDDGQTHLLDFGIAKLVDPDLADGLDGAATQAPGRALTPDYASPEQVRGESIGTASDVYSLGVVLFELVAGDRPHRFARGLSIAALAAALTADEPPRASARCADPQVARRLQGDLDAILQRALARDAEARYPTMDAFADDLDRHLRGEPVRARPDTWWYRGERWVRRHTLESAAVVAIGVAVPAGAAAQASVLIAVAAGAGVALWQMREARRQLQRAQAEARRAEVVTGFLAGFFKSGSVDEDGGRRLGRMPVQQFVERGARQVVAGFAQEPQVRAELLDAVSGFFVDLGDGPSAIDCARRWQESLAELGRPEADRGRASLRVAEGLALAGQHREAVALLDAAQSRLGSGAPVVLRAQLLVDRARLRLHVGDPDVAGVHVDAALALLRSEDADRGAVAADARYLRAEVLASANRIDDAIPIYDDALARMESLHGARSTLLGRRRFSYASALNGVRQATAAARQYRAARAIFREAGGDDDLDAAIIDLEFGRVLAISGTERAEGLQLLRHACDVVAKHGDAVAPLHGANAHLFLAEALLEDGDLEQAAAPMEAAVAAFRDRVEDSVPRLIADSVHARYLAECGEYEASNRILAKSRIDRELRFGAQHPNVAAVVNRIGLNFLRMQSYAQARAAFTSVMAFEDEAGGQFGSPKHLAALNLAVVEMEEGAAARVLPAMRAHWDAYLARPQARNVLSEASLAMNLGRALLECGDVAEALPLLRRAVDVQAESYPKSLGLASARCWLALALLAAGQRDEAERLGAQAEALLRAQPRCGPHYRRGLKRLEAALRAATSAA